MNEVNDARCTMVLQNKQLDGQVRMWKMRELFIMSSMKLIIES